MGLFDQFPYTNFHELNLDWILQALKELEHTIDQFVAINALKYADPIQWDITSQYEKNTIVIDPQSGSAYISVQAVPAGVALTDTNYWTVVFDLEQFVTKANGNFTPRVEVQTTTTATFNTPKGNLVIWGGDLYQALVNITAGDQYVVDSNIKRVTVEDIVGSRDALTTTDKSNLVAAINEVAAKLAAEVVARDTADGNLADLTTTDKSNLVAAINEANTTSGTASAKIGDLDNLTTTDKSNVVAAINEVNTTSGTASAKIGDLDNLTTTDKSNVVAAINEVYSLANLSNVFINVKDYGAKGDGITDDTTAIKAAVDFANLNGGTVFFPQGIYLINDTITVTASNVNFMGETRGTKLLKGSNYGDTIIFHNGSSQITGNSVYNLTFDYNSIAVTGTHITYDRCDQGQVINCLFNGGKNGILILGSTDIKIDHCALIGFHDYGSDTGIKITNSNNTTQISSYIEIVNTRIFGPLNKGYDICLAIYGGEFINVHDSYLGQGYYQDILIRDLDNVILEVTIDSCYIDGVSTNGGIIILDGNDNSKYIGNVKIINSNIKGQDGSGTNGVAIGGNTNRGGNYPFAVCGFIMEGCTVSGWGQNGVVIQSGNSITISDNHIDSNNAQSSTLTTGEVVIYENVKKVYINNNSLGRIDNHNGTTDTSYAVYYTGSNTYTDEIIIKDNLISGVSNTTNGLPDYSTTKSVYDNNYHGQTSELKVPTFPASDVAIVNPYGCDAFVAIYGTSISAVKVNGTNLGTPSSINLRANDSIAITYAGSGQGWYWLI